MRKFFLGAALVAASFGMAQSADAATVMDVDGVSTVLAISDYEGTYNGTMDQIKMRGEDYEPRAASYMLEQNNSSLFCQATKLNSERVRRKLSNGFLLALFLCVTKKKLSQYIHLTQWGRHHYPVSKAAMPLKTLPVCNRRRGNKIIQTA